MSALPSSITSVAGVVDVEVLIGAQATPQTKPTLLVEVPHGADRREHYDALRARMQGALPADLHCFFHVNTDVGAYAYGRATAERVLAQHPTRSALLVRSRIPRTLIDCNRPATQHDGDLRHGGLTAGIPAYVKDDRDKALLIELHRRYVDVVTAAFAFVLGDEDEGGLALLPHTYGPRSMGIAGVGEDIVEQLKRACAPGVEETWPLRPEIDLLTRDGEGREWSPAGMEQALLDAFAAAGFAPKANHTYHLHPSSLGHTWATRYPHRVLCLEVRRDLLVPRWTPFEEMRAEADKVARVACVLAPVIARALR